jgi:glycosidase
LARQVWEFDFLMMEFHISRNARERYQFAETLFSYSGNVVFANMAACREFAYRMNKVRDVEKRPERVVHAGKLYAMGLIDEASHVLMARYREQFDPQVMTGALEWFSAIVGAEPLGKMLLTFVEDFPGITVMRGDQTPAEWLAGATDGTSHWAVAFEELLLLWTANRNEAFKPFRELFEEKRLAEKTVYRKVTRHLPEYFATRPLIPLPNAKPMNLLELLRAPAVVAPGSLSDQLALIRRLWKPLIGDCLEHLLAIATEILHEEELAIWMQFNPPDEAARRRREAGKQQWPGVVATAQVPEFGDPAHEYETFSPDQAWMPTAVLIAKSTYVWLAQMSRKYGRWIKRLDEIPDEELATLANRGLNTLWLIGVWERSRASKTIKQLCGNSDAVASAYSLFDYAIADDLGGEAAYTNLRDRAYKYGLRLASDMVPNHMGIDSPWVVEHPDWFISRQEAPYPAYSFNGPDLSQDGRVEIKIEDHYFEQSDAAVVFQRRDRSSGETRYIYHGNDGTSFPWNDTAQLDYLNPAVREQVIQTILHVARLFPVIRFDAAMTLAKRHFHRLWFPGPGSSGAIPSRAESGMSQAEFDRCMPHEFWREVVDRVAAEVPGTLLLAEAFWLMEGYFVRTLGMHRVYNSAFMVMLRDEDNAKYRSVIKKTLEFDPDIMKRYVNFMSNPDERTAIDQFGKGDKCFGVATMMATLPGLPMFGHGQIEGFTEKYGMEYQRPRYDENPDPWLVERHDREIAPLLKRRRLFAESGNFLLYDFFTDAGKVDENVFAYSNRNGNERALIVFNNHYGETHGTIDYSAAYADKGANQLRQQKVSDGLGFGGGSGAVLAWRDSLTGLEYLRRSSDLAHGGLTLDLHAYQCHVFLDWCQLYSTQEKPWDRLADQLNGRGVPSLEDALVNLELQPVHDALHSLLDAGLVRIFADVAEHPRTLAVGVNTAIEAERTKFFNEAWARCESFMRAAQKAYIPLIGGAEKLAGGLPSNPGLMGAAFRARLRAAMRIPAIEALFPVPWSTAARRMLPSPSPQLTATAIWGPVLAWCVLELLAESIDAEKPEPIALDLFDRLRLREPFAQVFTALGFEGEEAWRVAARVKVGLLTGAGAGRPEETAPATGAEDKIREEASDNQSEVIEHDHANSAEIPVVSVQASEHDFSRAATTSPSLLDLAPEEEAQLFPPALWLDSDVRWLTGVHRAGPQEFLVRESYEELLWWLLMPSLLRLAGETTPSRIAADRTAVQAMSMSIEKALAATEAAGYRVDLLMPQAAAEEPSPEAAPAVEPAAGAVAEVTTESISEVPIEAAAEPEPEPLAESAPAPTEEPKPIEPKIEATLLPEIEPATEPVSDAVVEAEVETIEPPAAAEPAPAEEQPQLAPAIEAAAEPEVESAVEPVIEAVTGAAAEEPALPEIPDSPAATQPEPEPAEPEIESAVEPVIATAVEPATEPVPEAAAEAEVETTETEAAAEPAPAEVQPKLAPVIAAVAQPEIADAIEFTVESAIDTKVEEAAEESVPEEAGDSGSSTELAESTPALAAEEPTSPISPEVPGSSVPSETEPAPEPSAEPEPSPAEDTEPVESAITPTAEPAAESALGPVVETADEPAISEAPAPAEERVSIEAQIEEPVEPAIEPVPEPLVETAIETTEESPETEKALSFSPIMEPEESTPVWVVGEPTPPALLESPDSLVVSEVQSEPESPSEPEPIPVKEWQFAEPMIVSAIEPPAEPVFDPLAEMRRVPVEEPEPAEPENDFSIEWMTAAPVLEAPAEAEPEPPFEVQFAPSKDQQPVEPEVEPGFRLSDFAVAGAAPEPLAPEAEAAAESSFDLSKFAATKAEVVPEPVEPVIEFAVEPASKPAVEAAPKAAVEPVTIPQAKPAFAVRLEPSAPTIEVISNPAAEVKLVAEVPRSLTERFEPPAPQIDFVAKPAAQASAGAEPSPSERWEPPAPKMEAAAKPRTLAGMLRSFKGRWEPPPPKIEFVAKPATEDKAENSKTEEPDGDPPKPA